MFNPYLLNATPGQTRRSSYLLTEAPPSIGDAVTTWADASHRRNEAKETARIHRDETRTNNRLAEHRQDVRKHWGAMLNAETSDPGKPSKHYTTPREIVLSGDEIRNKRRRKQWAEWIASESCACRHCGQRVPPSMMFRSVLPFSEDPKPRRGRQQHRREPGKRTLPYIVTDPHAAYGFVAGPVKLLAQDEADAWHLDEDWIVARVDDQTPITELATIVKSARIAHTVTEPKRGGKWRGKQKRQRRKIFEAIAENGIPWFNQSDPLPITNHRRQPSPTNPRWWEGLYDWSLLDKIIGNGWRHATASPPQAPTSPVPTPANSVQWTSPREVAHWFHPVPDAATIYYTEWSLKTDCPPYYGANLIQADTIHPPLPHRHGSPRRPRFSRLDGLCLDCYMASLPRVYQRPPQSRRTRYDRDTGQRLHAVTCEPSGWCTTSKIQDKQSLKAFLSGYTGKPRTEDESEVMARISEAGSIAAAHDPYAAESELPGYQFRKPESDRKLLRSEDDLRQIMKEAIEESAGDGGRALSASERKSVDAFLTRNGCARLAQRSKATTARKPPKALGK